MRKIKWIAFIIAVFMVISCGACNRTTKNPSSKDQSAIGSSSDSQNPGSSADESESGSSSGNNESGLSEDGTSAGNSNDGSSVSLSSKISTENTVSLKASSKTADLSSAAVKTTGKSTVTTLSSTVWSDAAKYTCRTLSGKGSSISFVLSDLKAGKELTLEVEEIHQRTDPVMAYSVYVNSSKVYFRTYDPSSDGGNHYFISVNGNLIGNDGKASVTFVNEDAAMVRFRNVWGFSDMDGLLKSEKVSRKMSVTLLAPQISYNLTSDKATIGKIVSQFGSSDMYDVSFGLEISYIAEGISSLHNRVDYLMSLSAATGTKFQLGLNSWWAGTPNGMDGLGGMWSDMTYQQVVYDPLNVDGRGTWKLSTPNIWSDTPWLTMNNDTYNNARNYRLTDITRYIQKKIADYRAKGGNQPSVGVYMENEPVYWPYYAFNASPEAAGDFNSAVISAAKKDGITLNPEDGLSNAEKVWLYKNLRTYIAQEGIAVASGFQYDTVVVNNGKTTLPSTQQSENAYTHAFPNDIYPLVDENYCGWETHMTNTLRFGGEWASEMTDERPLDYVATRGKFSDVNAERSSMGDYSLLPQAYLYGADHVTIYNFKTSDYVYYQSAGGKTGDTKTTTEYNKEIMSYDFKKSDCLKANSTLVSATNMKRTAIGEKYYAGPDNVFAKGGSLTFKIDNKGTSLSNGMVISLDGRILIDSAPNMNMTIYAGSAVNNLQEVTTIKTLIPNTVDVSDYIDKTKSVAYIKIQLVAGGASFTDWCSLSKIKVFTKWTSASGNANGKKYNLLQTRNHNLYMGYRADVERLLANYEKRAGKDANYQKAYSLYKNMQYVSAYNILVSNISETLPASYLVTGQGQLGKYGVTLSTGNTTAVLDVTLTKAASENYIFTMTSTKSLNVNASFSATNGSYYVLNNLGSGKFEMKKVSSSTSGAVKAGSGKAVFNVALTATSDKKQLPSTFEARAYSDGSISAIKVQAQDYRVSDYSNITTLNISNTCKVWTGNDGASDVSMIISKASLIKAGDYLKIKVDSNNKVVEIRAYRGKITGTVTAVNQISLKGTTRNASVTVKDSNGALHTFEIGGECTLAYSGRTGDQLKLTKIGNLGISVGQKLVIDYCPWKFNGRSQRAFKIS